VRRLTEERVGFDNQLAAIERTLTAKQKVYMLHIMYIMYMYIIYIMYIMYIMYIIMYMYIMYMYTIYIIYNIYILYIMYIKTPPIGLRGADAFKWGRESR
jgi:hypothetical protein